MWQDHFYLSEMDMDRIRALSEAYHLALIEFIESRKIRRPPHERDDERTEMQNFQSVCDELEMISAEQKNDF